MSYSLWVVIASTLKRKALITSTSLRFTLRNLYDRQGNHQWLSRNRYFPELVNSSIAQKFSFVASPWVRSILRLIQNCVVNILFLIPVVKSHSSLTIGLLSILFVVNFYTHIDFVQLLIMLPSFGLYPENASHFSHIPRKR